MQRLELTWIGKGQEPEVEPRILLHDPSKDYGAPDSENMLIHGDNLLALKALEQQYAGQVKCIYIDPPYNTGYAFEHYDDNLEHSQWLSLIRPRLELLWKLLSEDGSLWISIDDDEQAYMKVLCDELFGRQKFIASIIWQKRTSPDMRAVISDGHDYILVYAKDRDKFKETRNLIPLTAEQATNYKNPDNDPRGVWVSTDFTAQGWRPNQMYTITTPSGKELSPPEGRCWRHLEDIYKALLEDGRLWFGADGSGVPRKKVYLSESAGIAPWTWWTNKEVGHNQEAKKENNALFGSANAFDTPKPERLIQHILHIASNEGDLVLDSFLGSGTTCAVAHKMGRKYIGIEMGEHAYTHCKKRLDMVISGEDKGGISKAVNWQSGGGYRFYELAPTLINKDEFGEYVINPDYSPEMLAGAVALHEGFTYEPDRELFWKQSHGSEKSYLFVTTRHINTAFLEMISGGMQEDEFLVIACCSFDKGIEKQNPHIMVKKIPQMLLERCEFDKNDYSFNIIHPPVYDDEEESDNES